MAFILFHHKSPPDYLSLAFTSAELSTDHSSRLWFHIPEVVSISKSKGPSTVIYEGYNGTSNKHCVVMLLGDQ